MVNTLLVILYFAYGAYTAIDVYPHFKALSEDGEYGLDEFSTKILCGLWGLFWGPFIISVTIITIFASLYYFVKRVTG
jgi:hypothetical protein